MTTMSDPHEVIVKALTDNRYDYELGENVSEVAGIVVSALSAAGYVLLPPGGEPEVQWGSQEPTEPSPYFTADSRQAAELRVKTDRPWLDVRLVRREVRAWDDGSEWTGPWTPVGDSDG